MDITLWSARATTADFLKQGDRPGVRDVGTSAVLIASAAPLLVANPDRILEGLSSVNWQALRVFATKAANNDVEILKVVGTTTATTAAVGAKVYLAGLLATSVLELGAGVILGGVVVGLAGGVAVGLLANLAIEKAFGKSLGDMIFDWMHPEDTQFGMPDEFWVDHSNRDLDAAREAILFSREGHTEDEELFNQARFLEKQLGIPFDVIYRKLLFEKKQGSLSTPVSITRANAEPDGGEAPAASPSAPPAVDKAEGKKGDEKPSGKKSIRSGPSGLWGLAGGSKKNEAQAEKLVNEGDYETAAGKYRLLAKYYRSIGNKAAEAKALENENMCMALELGFRQEEEAFARAEAGEREAAAESYDKAADAFEKAGEHGLALEMLNNKKDIWASARNFEKHADTLMEIGRFMSAHDMVEAEAVFRKAYETYVRASRFIKAGDGLQALALNLFRQAQAIAAMGYIEQADSKFNEAVERFKHLGTGEGRSLAVAALREQVLMWLGEGERLEILREAKKAYDAYFKAIEVLKSEAGKLFSDKGGLESTHEDMRSLDRARDMSAALAALWHAIRLELEFLTDVEPNPDRPQPLSGLKPPSKPQPLPKPISYKN